jgi:hypothetical protein
MPTLLGTGGFGATAGFVSAEGFAEADDADCLGFLSFKGFDSCTGLSPCNSRVDAGKRGAPPADFEKNPRVGAAFAEPSLVTFTGTPQRDPTELDRSLPTAGAGSSAASGTGGFFFAFFRFGFLVPSPPSASCGLPVFAFIHAGQRHGASQYAPVSQQIRLQPVGPQVIHHMQVENHGFQGVPVEQTLQQPRQFLRTALRYILASVKHNQRVSNTR